MNDVDLIVIGAGVVGLAVARAAALAGQDVLVVERHGLIGSETSSRNSEVIHAGIYYPAGSLKARLCVAGRHALYAFCESHHVPYAKLGKLLVAADEAQEAGLDAIATRAAGNGVDDLVRLTGAQACAMEPALHALGALHSPSTGIVDSHAFMLALQGDAEGAGAMIAFHAPVEAIEAHDGGYTVRTGGAEPGEVTATRLVVSAGLGTQGLLAGTPFEAVAPTPRVYAKGNYFSLGARAPFSRLIYPVPTPGGLGVHLTLDLNGQARFGPDVEWVDTLDYRVDPGRADIFYDAIRRYWPGLPDASLTPDYSGIRPKLVGRGEPNGDFALHDENAHGQPNAVVAAGIESPGLTASLAIADAVMERLG